MSLIICNTFYKENPPSAVVKAIMVHISAATVSIFMVKMMLKMIIAFSKEKQTCYKYFYTDQMTGIDCQFKKIRVHITPGAELSALLSL